MQRLLFCLLLLAPAGVQAQVKVSEPLNATAETKYVVNGVDDYKIVMGQIVVPAGATPKIQAVGYVQIDAPNSHVAFKAKNSKFEPVEVVKSVSQNGVYEYLVFGNGRIFIDAISVDKSTGELQWDDFVITIGRPTPPPEPEPEPTPEPDPEPVPDDVPDDVFDNIGKRVAGWAVGLPKRKEAGQIYRDAAGFLRSEPSMTQNDVADYLVGKLDETVGTSYAAIRTSIQTDLNKRWEETRFSRGLLADYFDAIANGLEAGQQ